MSIDERCALNLHFQAIEKLKALGWREMHLAPTDGTVVLVVEPHSTGIFRAQVREPNGWWVQDTDDFWPSDPMLWKPVSECHEEGL